MLRLRGTWTRTRKRNPITLTIPAEDRDLSAREREKRLMSRDLQAALEASDRELEDRRWRNADLQRQEFGRKIGLIKG